MRTWKVGLMPFVIPRVKIEALLLILETIIQVHLNYTYIDEKKLLQLYSRDEYLEDETAEQKPEDFRRRQSLLYNKMHPVMVAF